MHKRSTAPPGARLESVPAALVLVSLLAGAAFFRYYLHEVSWQFAETFELQNSAAIASGDVLTLASRLNSVGASVHWTCISAERGGRPFFQQSRGPCGNGLLRQRVSVYSPNNEGLRIAFTLRLPRTLERAAAAFLFLQTALLVALFLGVRHLERIRSEGHRRLGELAAQVAHDIRSPLAALESLAGGLSAFPGRDARLMREAMARIRAIADDLLERHRGAGGPGVLPVRIAELAEQVVAEKRPSLPPAVSLEFAAPEAARAEAAGDPAVFQRILSNLIDNAVQALPAGGRVRVEAGLGGTHEAFVAVQDDGPGIPADVLPKLGAKGASFGKEHGTGLGLYHARTSAESWGGRLDIESGPAQGTRVVLWMRLLAGGAACASEAVLVDDDPLVRASWTLAAKRAGCRLRVFADGASVLAEAEGIPRGVPVYLDSDLGGGERGEEVALRLSGMGFRELHLETGEDPAAFSGLAHIRSVRGKAPPWPAGLQEPGPSGPPAKRPEVP